VQLEDRTVAVYLTPQGFEQLNFLLGLEEEHSGAAALVINTDGFGIWISLAGHHRRRRILIVPWHYLRLIEVEPETEVGKEAKKKIGYLA
jgi:hypothetical protein